MSSDMTDVSADKVVTFFDGIGSLLCDICLLYCCLESVDPERGKSYLDFYNIFLIIVRMLVCYHTFLIENVTKNVHHFA